MFTLADAAMAYASNAGNVRSLATSANIDFVRPAHIGDSLIATATQRSKPGRSAVHDVTIVNNNNETVAVFRGRTLSVGGAIVGGEQPE